MSSEIFPIEWQGKSSNIFQINHQVVFSQPLFALWRSAFEKLEKLLGCTAFPSVWAVFWKRLALWLYRHSYFSINVCFKKIILRSYSITSQIFKQSILQCQHLSLWIKAGLHGSSGGREQHKHAREPFFSGFFCSQSTFFFTLEEPEFDIEHRDVFSSSWPQLGFIFLTIKILIFFALALQALKKLSGKIRETGDNWDVLGCTFSHLLNMQLWKAAF